MPTRGGAAATAGHRHSLEVEGKRLLKDLFFFFAEWLLKDLAVILIFLRMFCTVRCFF
jgi:hypothetical protein